MLIKKSPEHPVIRWSEVSPKSVYLNRRRLLKGAGVAAAAAAAGFGLLDWSAPSAHAGTKLAPLAKSPFSANEAQTPYNVVTTYNNFYEFGTAKEQPAELAKNFKTSPWSVSVEGLVAKPRKYDFNEIMKLAPLEERVYRHR